MNEVPEIGKEIQVDIDEDIISLDVQKTDFKVPPVNLTTQTNITNTTLTDEFRRWR